MLKVRHFELSCQILAHFGFHESYTFQKVGTGSNKMPEKLNVHIRNSWRTNLQLIRSIGNMIGYKKSLSEWQCLSEVKMGRGSPIPPILRRKIVEQYLSFSEKNCKEFEVIIIYSGIISSKDSENLELSLCVRVKAGKPYWMPVIFGPLDGTASHTEMLP